MKNKNNKLLIVENDNKWNLLMNSLVRCTKQEEEFIIKQLDRLNAELVLLKETK